MRRWLLARASRALAQTAETVESLSALVPEERISILPNPVILPSFPPPLNGRLRAAFVGRLSAEKGLDILLDAWRGIAASHDGSTLVIAGTGGDHRSVEREIRERVVADPLLRDSVDMVGWIEDPLRLLASADLFVLPSREEGMSNALLEACAAGRVVIASDIGPNRTVLGQDYPLMYPPDDPKALEMHLRRALSDEQQIRERSRALTLERARSFSSDTVISKLEDLIDAADRPRH